MKCAVDGRKVHCRHFCLEDFLNGKETLKVSYLTKALQEDVLVFIIPVILQEVLQGIREDKYFENVKTTLLNFPFLEWDPVEASLNAANLYRVLRKMGVTIRKTNDCLIAAFAIQYSIPLLCNDADFTLISSKERLLLIEP